eukprot:CAMPEP_0194037028 /NCGR_PEP_ID=MMETSP0009_2-20130614/9387_1 /TAXON_ID=210454 /ORGANISM="Grammatophora oceanica, Strain CCMP 410" /LENGTH=316 /DNA_ID=CAMNT_0038679019 /DNA_START=129 /DNA_END=1076 /DNA_ORIENTATION=+
MMNVTLLVLSWSILGLWSVGLVAAGDWRDEIPPSEDFLEPSQLSKAVFEVNDFDELQELDMFDAIVFEETQAETEVLVVRSDKTRSIIIAFRGTNVEELKDLTANAQLIQKDFFGMGKVHRGFKNKLLNNDLHIHLTDAVDAELDRNPSYSVVVTGHSQGAALATLFGAYMVGTNKLSSWKRVTVVAIGSPRVGSGSFKRYVRENLQNLAIFRVVKEEDIVCRLPGTFFNYRHVGHMIKVNFATMGAQAYFQQTGDGDRYKGVDPDDWDLTVNWSDLGDWRTDHAINDYIAAVALATEGSIQWPTGFVEGKKKCRW